MGSAKQQLSNKPADLFITELVYSKTRGAKQSLSLLYTSTT
jgi:hypothetical protein